MIRCRTLSWCPTAALIAATTLMPFKVLDDSANVTFVLVNDIYEMSGNDGRGSFARLASVVKAERAARD